VRNEGDVLFLQASPKSFNNKEKEEEKYRSSMKSKESNIQEVK